MAISMADVLGFTLEMQRADHAGLIALLEREAVGPSLRLESDPASPCVTLSRVDSHWWIEVTPVGLTVVDTGRPEKAAKAWIGLVERRASGLQKAIRVRLEGVGSLPAPPVNAADLAERIGVHPEAVARWWHGKRVEHDGVITPLSILLPLE